MFIIFLMIMILNLYVHFVKKEVNPEKNEFNNVIEVLILMKNFLKNANLRTLCIIFFLFRIGFAPVDAGFIKKYFFFNLFI